MRKTTLMMCCSAALVLGVAGCNPERTDDTLADTPETAMEPTMPPMDQTPPPGTAANQTMAEGSDVLRVATGTAGAYVADNQGRAVYMLEGDTDGSKCTAACEDAWPPLRTQAGTTGAGTGTTGAAGTTAAGGNLRMDLIGTIQRSDGTYQVTYNGHPLYHYAKETGGTTTAGQGVDDQWGEWYLVTPDGEAMEEGA